MASFVKDVMRAGIFPKGDHLIRLRDDHLKQAIINFGKMKSLGYNVPVIIEHAKATDPEGLPVHTSQMTARDKAKYQAGWSKDLKIDQNGIMQVDMDVKSKDGLKLIKEVGTFVSPQFGPWTFPGEKDPTPMVITHFALTPYPVDIGQNATFREIPDTEPIEAVQLSQLVSFSMADMIPEIPDTGDTDADDDGIVDDSPTDKLIEQTPSPNYSETFGKIVEALGQLGVILPQGTDHVNNPQALLAGLMTCLHHTNQAKADEAAALQQVNQAPQPGQNLTTDPRLQGTKQENMITMSQTSIAHVLPDVTKDPAFIQMSQTVERLTEKNTLLERERYSGRLKNLVSTGRMTQIKADELAGKVQTYQFSVTETSTDLVKLESTLEYAESLPEGAVLSLDQRTSQMSLQKQDPFFKSNGDRMDPAEEDADLEAYFPLPAK